MRFGAAADDVRRERLRAHSKHAARGQSAEQMHHNDPRWLPILVEEVGEVAREICDHGYDRVHLRDELIQVAAMAQAWADSIGTSALDRGA